jgi:carbon storage regulator
MLVLTRKCGEEIWIGEQIRFFVVDVRRRCVKLAIDAPASVIIRRGELVRQAPDAGDIPVVVGTSASETT